MTKRIWREAMPGEEMPSNPVEVLAWHMHWLFHRRAVCQCVVPDECDEREKAAEALSDLEALSQHPGQRACRG